MAIKIRCAKREPNQKLFGTRDFVVCTNQTGDVVVNTILQAREWTSKEDPIQCVVFTRRKAGAAATEHKNVLVDHDLRVVELTSPKSKDYIIMVKPEEEK